MGLLRKFSKKRYFKNAIVYFLTCCMFFNTSLSVVLAGPEGAQVINGQVSFQQSGYNTTIVASDKSIINYSSFDIARPEIVQFIQPGSSASVLNRILSANPTNINGTLLANGRVFFVNPAGVYIGAGARVNVSQLVASGLNITNSDFINGQYNFAGGNGSVVNSGDISAQEVYLIGKQVTNSGTISCPDGYVVMASGDRVFLGEPGTDVVLEMDAPSGPEPAEPIEGSGILNEGTVDTAGGTIVLAAGDIYSQAISNTGSLSASVETGDAGQITITAIGGEITNTGTIEASGSKGGKVVMEGARVGQFGTVHADGKDLDGGNINLTASDVVALSSDSLNTANADTNGNGGEVIVYSPDTALFREGARIEVKGGIESGDGGFIEISGQQHVEVDGIADRTALNGDSGLLLIDPANISITDSEPDYDDNAWVGDDFAPTTPAGSPSQIDIDTLETHLGTGDTTITTAWSGPPGQDPGEDGNITFNAGRDVDYGGTNSFTVNAEGSIIFMTDSGINFTGNSDITLNVGSSGSVDLSANISTGGSLSGNATTVNVQSTDAQIQDAIDLAATNAIINVSAGTYPVKYIEDLTITTDGLELASASSNPDDVTIKGVANVDSSFWPLAAPNIEILGDGVKIHGFTIEGPDPVAGRYASGMVIGGLDVEVYDNKLFVPNASSWDDISQGIQTYHGSVNPAGTDLTGLNIHDNDFYALGSGTAGYEAIYINRATTDPTPAGAVTIADNTFNDELFRGVTTERSNVVISGNTFNTTLLADDGDSVGEAWQAILVRDWALGSQQDVTISNNTIGGVDTGDGFAQGIRIGTTGQSLTNITVQDNTVTDSTVGVQVRDSAGGVVVNNNNISGNGTGVANLDAGNTLDATSNWWGDTDPSDDISGDVDYSPWWGGNYVGDSHATSWTWWTNDSIQDAIDATSDNDKVIVETSGSPYIEDLTITTDGLELASASSNPDDVTIKGVA
ncbi:MAG: filamentous hemagglutinin N-terminal domain-containing protein, partial [Sedimentisphaerales bacterium]|nr:filamentous hemagglutinin N-terminal domain-containing protein [Sedimentisphaerales bacterium]